MSALRSAILCALLSAVAGAGELRLEFEHTFGDVPLRLGQDYRLDGRQLSVSRLDYLVSGFALQKEDGEWIEADAKLVGFVGEGRGLRTIDLGEAPPGSYRALRFHIGVGAVHNASDPNIYPPGHALHPTHCGLHWGWQGGYIFMALEGHIPDGAFSYHLAENVNRVAVEVPLELQLAKRATAAVRFDVATLFEGEQGVRPHDGEVSTHSRSGDPLPAKLVDRIGGAFAVTLVRPEHFHSAPPIQETPAAAQGTPYRLRVSNRMPTFEVPADNPLTVEGVALGRRLFHDPLLSRDGTISCASCHDRSLAFTDGKPVSEGIGGVKGTRNAMPLANLLWVSEFFWDGHAPSLRRQVLEPIQDDREMGESLSRVVRKLVEGEGYPEAFEAAFGARAVTPDRIAKALEQFLLTLVSQDSRFDRAMRGEVELTKEERRGFQLFVTEKDPKLGLRGADCFHCHSGSLFTTSSYANNGLDLVDTDLGRMAVTDDSADRGKFKTPSLRNIALTAPYMHDARFETLEQVIEHYDSGVVRTPNLDPNIAKHPTAGLELSAGDKKALVAFLETLTDDAFVGR